ncbi:metallophosphoesterase [bacterium]|nr:metallophosphoesterase [bacterium]
MKIFFTADIHLKEYGDERWKALEEICKIAHEKKCEHLIIGGDLFDDISTVRELGQKMGDEIFNNFDFTVHIIPGNHDLGAFTKRQFLGKKTRTYLEYEYIDLEGTILHFFPFIKENDALSKMLFQLSQNKGKRNILILHTNLNRIIFDNNNEKDYEYMESELDDFSGYGIDLVLAGHIHSRVQHWGYEDGEFYYSGSPVSITKKETGLRHALIIDPDDLNVEGIPLNTFHYDEFSYFFNLNDNDIMGKLSNDISTIENNAFLLLNLSGFIKGDENEIRKKIEEIVNKNFKNRNKINFNIHEMSLLEEDNIFKDFKALSDKDETLNEMDKTFLIEEFIKASRK